MSYNLLFQTKALKTGGTRQLMFRHCFTSHFATLSASTWSIGMCQKLTSILVLSPTRTQSQTTGK